MYIHFFASNICPFSFRFRHPTLGIVLKVSAFNIQLLPAGQRPMEIMGSNDLTYPRSNSGRESIERLPSGLDSGDLLHSRQTRRRQTCSRPCDIMAADRQDATAPASLSEVRATLLRVADRLSSMEKTPSPSKFNFLSKDQLTKKKERILIRDLISNKQKYKTKKARLILQSGIYNEEGRPCPPKYWLKDYISPSKYRAIE